MTPRLVNAGGRPMHDPDVKQAFGLQPKDKWPVQGMTPRLVQGVWCGVDVMRFDQGFRIRAWAECPNCRRRMPIGRLNQHWELVHDVDHWLDVLRKVDKLSDEDLVDEERVRQRLASYGFTGRIKMTARLIAGRVRK